MASHGSMPKIESGAGRKVNHVPGALLLLVVSAVLVRGFLLGFPALCDTTESRYGMIGFEMARSGDWLTPRLWYKGVELPFWGKPPLHFWATAVSFRVFGQNEQAARIPGFLSGLAILASAILFARRFWGMQAAAISGGVLATSVLFLVLSGSCTTDITLAGFMAVAMASFAFCASASMGWSRRLWGLAFFAAMAGGVLTKGPVALVLAGLALFAWAAIKRRWRDILALPWVAGIPLFLALTVPWFLAEERATPGFLRYYFVNEHFLRYVRHDYGDLYGGGHRRPWGFIWLYMAGSFLPWIFFWFRPAKRFFSRVSARREIVRDGWLVYALAWGLAPAVFFTFARQVLATYLAPGMAGMAVATGVMFSRRDNRAVIRTGWGVLLAAVLAVPVAAPFISEQFSACVVVRAVSADPALTNKPLRFPLGEPYSGDFYSWKYLGRGIVHDPGQPGEECMRLAVGNRSRALLVMPRRKFLRLPPHLVSGLEKAVETRSWVVFRVKGAE